MWAAGGAVVSRDYTPVRLKSNGFLPVSVIWITIEDKFLRD